MSLRGSAKGVRNIQQFNFFVHFSQELFQTNFFTLVPLRNVHTIVILK